MLFNSFYFLLFFPLVTILYFLLPHKFRWLHLLVASCIFYCFFIPEYLIILFVTILIDYFAAIHIEKTEGKKRKALLWVSVIATLLVLVLFKYFNFFGSNFNQVAHFFQLNYSAPALDIILPIGLSFHTFQSLSYVIEVYRGRQKAEKHFGIYSLYVMFYPQLVAGPIERAKNILPQLREKHNFKYDDAVYGLKKIAWGLFKKVVIADRLGLYVNAVYNNSDQHNGSSLLLASLFGAFQIYCDFSGYSDIAIGSARVLGIKLMTNFKRPFFAQSIGEFWRRWHISLSMWFRDYVFVSLPGNKTSSARRYFNLFITFVLSGFWHGANWTFVIWGGINGIYLIVGQVFFKTTKAASNAFTKMINILTTFFLFCLSGVFFRSSSVEQAISIFKKMLFEQGQIFSGGNKNSTAIALLLVLLAAEAVDEFKSLQPFGVMNSRYVFVRSIGYVSLTILILMFGVFDSSEFIYFQF